MLIKLMLPVTVLMANVAGLAIQLLLPKFLSAANYSYFALAWSVGQFLVALLYEWMRYGVLRFAGDEHSAVSVTRRNSLLGWYVVTTFVLLIIAVIAVGVGWSGFEFGYLAGGCVFYAVTQGVFEGRQTLSRAFSADRSYSLAGALRSLISLPLVLGFAWFFDSGLSALLGLGLAYLVALILCYWSDFSRLTSALLIDRCESGFLFKYGAMIAFSSSLSLFLFVVVKAVSVRLLGAEGAAGLLFAADLSLKAIAIVGMAVNIIVSQRAIKSLQNKNSAESERRVTEQISVTAAFVLPAGVGLYLIQPSLIDILVPVAYLAGYRESIFWACICGTIYAFRAFAIDALFVIAGRSRFSFVGPVVALLVVLFLYTALLGLGTVSAVAVLGCLSIGLVAGCVASVVVVRNEISLEWPLRDLALVVLGCVCMSVATMSMPFSVGYSHLTISMLVSICVYGIFSYIVDLCGLRSFIKSKALKGQ